MQFGAYQDPGFELLRMPARQDQHPLHGDLMDPWTATPELLRGSRWRSPILACGSASGSRCHSSTTGRLRHHGLTVQTCIGLSTMACKV
jgi:hypothetical protein